MTWVGDSKSSDKISKLPSSFSIEIEEFPCRATAYESLNFAVDTGIFNPSKLLIIFPFSGLRIFTVLSTQLVSSTWSSNIAADVLAPRGDALNIFLKTQSWFLLLILKDLTDWMSAMIRLSL